MNGTARVSLYKIWRSPKGRSLKRWLTDEQVAKYKERNPNWRWYKIETQGQQSSQSVYARPSQSYGYDWGRYTLELRDAKRHNPNKEKISWDDILDVLLSLPTYSEKKGI